LNPSINYTTLQALIHQINVSYHETINTITKQMTIVFNPMIENTTASYQVLSEQTARIAMYLELLVKVALTN